MVSIRRARISNKFLHWRKAVPDANELINKINVKYLKEQLGRNSMKIIHRYWLDLLQISNFKEQKLTF